MEKEVEKVKTALEDFGRKVVDAVKKGKGEADKVTRIAQVRIEIGSLSRQQKDLFHELGELFFRNYQKSTAKGQAEIVELVTQVGELEKRVAALKRQLKAVREDKPVARRGRPPKAAAAKKEAPKRRGRPPKAAAAKKEAPKRRGRPPKAAAAKKEAPKRRGRPPKAAK